MRISLHHLTVADVSPMELAKIAAELKYNHICLFLKVPGEAGPFPRVQSVKEATEIRKYLEDNGLSVYNTDTYMNYEGSTPEAHAETLDIAAALGAKVINTLALDPNRKAATERLAKLSQMAKKVGLQVILEWYRFSEVKTMKDSLAFIKEAGGDNLALNVDVLHLIRNGELPADMKGVDPALMRYAQISDGPMKQPDDKQPDEAVANRNIPGAEEFPLVDFLKALPKDATVSIEAPINRFKDKMGPKERAKAVLDGARKMMAAAGV